MLWGQPIAILLAALASFVDISPPAIYWSATIVLLLAAQFVGTSEKLGAIGRDVAMLLALSVGAIHLVTTRPTDPMAWLIDLTLIAVPMALLSQQKIQRRWRAIQSEGA